MVIVRRVRGSLLARVLSDLRASAISA